MPYKDLWELILGRHRAVRSCHQGHYQAQFVHLQDRGKCASWSSKSDDCDFGVIAQFRMPYTYVVSSPGWVPCLPVWRKCELTHYSSIVGGVQEQTPPLLLSAVSPAAYTIGSGWQFSPRVRIGLYLDTASLSGVGDASHRSGRRSEP